MSKFRKEFVFELSEPIKFQYEMGEKETKILLFRAPANKHHTLLDKLRKELTNALLKTGSQTVGFEQQNNKRVKADDKSSELNADAILFILYGSDFDLESYKATFWEMIEDGLCLVDKRVPLTSSLIEDIWYEDRTDILGEYTANFILPSWMRRQLKG